MTLLRHKSSLDAHFMRDHCGMVVEVKRLLYDVVRVHRQATAGVKV